LWLRLDDVDLNAGKYGMIRIRAKTVNGEFWQPKTKVNRAVPISSSLRNYLDHYALKPSQGRWFFPSPKGFWYDPDNFSSNLKRLNNTTGLKWSCLDFRHKYTLLPWDDVEKLIETKISLRNNNQKEAINNG